MNIQHTQRYFEEVSAVASSIDIGVIEVGAEMAVGVIFGDRIACTDSSVMIHVLPIRRAGISPARSHL